MRKIIIGVIAVVMLAVPMALMIPASSAAEPGRVHADWKVQAGKNFHKAGEYTVRHLRSHRNTYLQDAIQAYGKPSSCRLVGGATDHVVATWASRGISIDARTYGGMPSDEDGCISPDLIHVSEIKLTDKRWVTSLGLRVGDPTTKLRRLYPRSPYVDANSGWRGNFYFLVWSHERCVLGLCSAYDIKHGIDVPQLMAQVKAGRVVAFLHPVGAEGE